MRELDWKDERGRLWRVRLPDNVEETEAPYGIPIGPPSVVDSLGLSEAQATRLHNQLHARGLFTSAHAKRNTQGVFAALQAALQVDVATILNAYAELDIEQTVNVSDNGHRR